MSVSDLSEGWYDPMHMIQSIKGILLGVWIGTIVTFVAISGILIANEQTINAPGEMSEALVGPGFLLFAFLALVTIVALSLRQKKKA